ncbi:DUF4386 domain-containing protein [Algoriphagus halophytocola]|uniref:DUF4386 domain-containing protein n=1 Tax=Algoriphagus halophytocola TaxID=2991499 RepID=UPI0022DE4DFD|nr:DUF4386 domain-containing protein [Algoriphagus sp. TR-M9]WBL41714.1 DUF4386 domain-containing protein [Algoriphagus sp. TR-M9]
MGNQIQNTPSVRLIGILYVFVIILAGFSQGYVREGIFVAGDALNTSENILENEGLFRLGLLTDLLAFLLDAIISVMLYLLLKPYGKTLALISSSLRLLAHPAIGTLNLLNHYLALHVLKSEPLSLSFNQDQIASLSHLYMDAHSYGYLIAGAFFGIHCLLLGVQLFQSGVFPKFLGILMFFAGLGYLIETFGDFAFPGNEALFAWIVGIAAALGEVTLAFYFLIKGSKIKSVSA